MKGLMLFLFLMIPYGVGAVEIREFPNTDQQTRYERLIDDLRCLVCQNQSLADSDADLARDLRDEVYQIIKSGKSEEEAIRFLTDRYGDFVLYRPPLKPMTVLLWGGPFLLLTGALVFLVSHARRRAVTTVSALSETEKSRLTQLGLDQPDSRP
jgi:cytochrome c-type biogenesis protein CcmH